MIASVYIPIDGKQYVTAENYNKVLCELKKVNYKVAELNELIEDQHKKICELVEQRDVGKSGSNFELPYEPIEVAQTLINAVELKDKDGNIRNCGYDIPHLRQIAEHLLVYCNNNKDKV